MTRSKNFCLTSFAWNATIGSRNFYSGWYVSAQISVLWIFQPLRQTHFRFECPTPGPPAPPLLSPSYYVWYSSSDAVFKSWPRSMSHESLCFKHESIDPYVDLWSLISTFLTKGRFFVPLTRGQTRTIAEIYFSELRPVLFQNLSTESRWKIDLS